MKWIILLTVVTAACSSPTAPTPMVPPVAVTPPVSVIPPVVTPPAPTRNPLLDDPRFSLTFYRQLALNAYELPSQFALRHWTRPPLVYLRTVDDLNVPVDSRLLDQTAAAIINTTSQWTGGAFGVAGLERGTSTKAGQAQWITVEWSTTGACGYTIPIGTEGSVITMNARRRECTCGPLVAKHELGHALGYYHTSADGPDLMAATFQGVCDKSLSEREIFHAKVAYSMPNGSLDP